MAVPPNLLSVTAQAVIARLGVVNGADPYTADLTATGAVFRGWQPAGGTPYPCVGVTIPNRIEAQSSTRQVRTTYTIVLYAYPALDADFGDTEDACAALEVDLRRTLAREELTSAIETVATGYGSGVLVAFVGAAYEGDPEQAQHVAPLQLTFTVSYQINSQTGVRT